MKNLVILSSNYALDGIYTEEWMKMVLKLRKCHVQVLISSLLPLNVWNVHDKFSAVSRFVGKSQGVYHGKVQPVDD